jgi:hypothetical protein
MCKLLVPQEVDRLLRYPRGRSARLAREGKLPSITLPDGELRFDEAEILRLVGFDGVSSKRASAKEVALGTA